MLELEMAVLRDFPTQSGTTVSDLRRLRREEQQFVLLGKYRHILQKEDGDGQEGGGVQVEGGLEVVEDAGDSRRMILEPDASSSTTTDSASTKEKIQKKETSPSGFAQNYNPSTFYIGPSYAEEVFKHSVETFPGPSGCEPLTFAFLINDYELHPFTRDYSCAVAEMRALVETCLSIAYFFNAVVAHEYYSCVAKVKEDYLMALTPGVADPDAGVEKTHNIDPDKWTEEEKRQKYKHCGADDIVQKYFLEEGREKFGLPPRFSDLVRQVDARCVKRVHIDLDDAVGRWTSQVPQARIEQLGIRDAVDGMRQSLPLHPTHGHKMWMMSLSYAWMVLIELFHLSRHGALHPDFDLHKHFSLVTDWAATDFYKRKFALCHLVQKVAKENWDQLLSAEEEAEVKEPLVYSLVSTSTTKSTGKIPRRKTTTNRRTTKSTSTTSSMILGATSTSATTTSTHHHEVDIKLNIFNRTTKRRTKSKVLSIAEIGVFSGETTEHVLKNCPLPEDLRLQVHLIDPWEDKELEFASMRAFVQNENAEFLDRLEKEFGDIHQSSTTSDKSSTTADKLELLQNNSKADEHGEAPAFFGNLRLKMPCQMRTASAPGSPGNESPSSLSWCSRTVAKAKASPSKILEALYQFIQEEFKSSSASSLSSTTTRLLTAAREKQAGLSLYEVEGAERQIIVSPLTARRHTYDNAGVFEWKDGDRNISADMVLTDLLRRMLAVGNEQDSSRGSGSSQNVVYLVKHDQDQDLQGEQEKKNNPEVEEPRTQDDNQKKVDRHYIINPAEPGIFFHRQSSVEAAKVFEQLDIVFIDGDHTYKGIQADLEAYAPKTRFILAGHDFATSRFPGIPVALSHFILPSSAKTDSRRTGDDSSLHERAGGKDFEQLIRLDTDYVWWIPRIRNETKISTSSIPTSEDAH
ncbi:unnamed protein product [Amoebophrya sp. A25]|nr:unnamed protein product [Amoebophrya sp. A25]|eukprot:GSA25T00008753001.1